MLSPQPTAAAAATAPPSAAETPLTADEEAAVAAVRSAGGGGEAMERAHKYVATLLGRANREHVGEDDVRQALEYFEAAKAANGADDFKAACSYFETSYLMNPKLTTLISAANMHLKLRNPSVAAEIYIRLLDNPTVPKRERAMVLRKLAESKTMLVGS